MIMGLLFILFSSSFILFYLSLIHLNHEYNIQFINDNDIVGLYNYKGNELNDILKLLNILSKLRSLCLIILYFLLYFILELHPNVFSWFSFICVILGIVYFSQKFFTYLETHIESLNEKRDSNIICSL